MLPYSYKYDTIQQEETSVKTWRKELSKQRKGSLVVNKHQDQVMERAPWKVLPNDSRSNQCSQRRDSLWRCVRRVGFDVRELVQGSMNGKQ